MKNRKGFTLIELLVVIAIIAILAAILFPVFAKAKRAAQASNCEANMKQIGNSFKMYLTDWDETYPTNRLADKSLATGVALSPLGTDGQGKPYRFYAGYRPWVECLYNYIEPVTADDDYVSVWKCGTATSKRLVKYGNFERGISPAALASGTLTYGMNYNLVEQPESSIKSASSMLLCREYDRMAAQGRTCANPNGTDPPGDTFLSDGADGLFLQWQSSSPANAPNVKLHGNGSHILFADGHVKLIDYLFFSGEKGSWQPVSQKDPADGLYYNCINNANPDVNRMIQITVQ